MWHTGIKPSISVFEVVKSSTLQQFFSSSPHFTRINMEAIYDEMRERNHKNVIANGFKHDTVIGEVEDPRRCLALYSMYGEKYDNSVSLTPAFWQLRADLEAAVGPEQVFYVPYNGTRGRDDVGGPLWGTLHFTSMQIVGFNDYDGVPPTKEFQAVARAVLQTHLRPFEIKYTGVIAVPSGLLMIGYPSADVNSARDVLREAFQRRKLPFKEPYYNNIVHSTLLRFSRPITEAETAAVMEVVKKYENIVLGKSNVREVSLSGASWRMQPWELPSDPKSVSIPLLDHVAMPRSRVICHRGLEHSRPGGFWCESSYEAFADHLSRGYGIEFDPICASDGCLIASHDSTLARLTGGKDSRAISEIPSEELVDGSKPLSISKPGRLATVKELLQLMDDCNGNGTSTGENRAVHALHMKGDRQDEKHITAVASILNEFPGLIPQIVVFDARVETAEKLAELIPGVQLAASIAHPADVERFGKIVHDTLMTVDEIVGVSERRKGLYQWVWLDEWDTCDAQGVLNAKLLYTAETIQKLREADLKIAIVSPELHATSPGLLGSEAHSDASSPTILFERISRIMHLGIDVICTDYPEEVSALACADNLE